jgi:hypothetical protein
MLALCQKGHPGGALGCHAGVVWLLECWVTGPVFMWRSMPLKGPLHLLPPCARGQRALRPGWLAAALFGGTPACITDPSCIVKDKGSGFGPLVGSAVECAGLHLCSLGLPCGPPLGSAGLVVLLCM